VIFGIICIQNDYKLIENAFSSFFFSDAKLGLYDFAIESREWFESLMEIQRQDCYKIESPSETVKRGNYGS